MYAPHQWHGVKTAVWHCHIVHHTLFWSVPHKFSLFRPGADSFVANLLGMWLPTAWCCDLDFWKLPLATIIEHTREPLVTCCKSAFPHCFCGVPYRNCYLCISSFVGKELTLLNNLRRNVLLAYVSLVYAKRWNQCISWQYLTNGVYVPF